MAIKRNFILSSGIGISANNLYLVASTASTNTSTGALVVTGGVGIGGSLNVNNKVRLADEVTITSISNNALSVLGSGSVSYTWSVGTTLSSSRYNLGSDLCLVPVGGSQSAIQTYWGLQLVGNNQQTPNSFSPTTIGVRDAFGVLIPNQQAASVGLAVIAHASQTADLQIWTTPSGLATTTYLAVKSNGQLYSYASIASTNTTTGALVITGGVGVGGSIYGGSTISAADNIEVKSAKEVRFNNSGNTFYTGFKAGANASNTTYTLPIAFPGSGTSVLQSDTSGTLSWVAMTSGGGSGTVNSGTLNSIPYYPAAGTAITGSSSFTNVGTGISITYTTPSTSSTTGALVVTGGVGIGDTLFVAGNISVNTGTNGLLLRKLVAGNFGAIYSTNVTASTTNYSFITDGASANLNGTTGVYLNISNTNKIQVTTNNINIVPTADSTSTSTGAFTVAGGVGIGGSTSIGGRLQMFNGANYTAFVSGATGNTTYTLPPTSPATGTSVLQSTSAGVLSWVAMTASGGLAISGASDGTVQIKSGSSLGGTNSLFFDTNLLGLRVSGFPGGNTPSGTDAALKVEQTVGSFNGNVNGTLIAANASSGFNGDLINLQLNAVTKFKVSASGAIGMSSDIVTTGVLSAGDLTNSTSTTTGALKVSGGAGITGNLFAGGNVRVTSSTASTSTATGALTVQGGLGVSGQLSMVSAALGFTGVQVNPSMAFIGNTSSAPITLTVLNDNSLSWEGTSGQLFAIDNNLTTGDIFSVSDISGLPIINASAGQTVTINEFGGYTQIGGGTINSASTTTGSLVIAGGLGMTGNAFIGGTTTITSGTNSINTGSGAFVVAGGMGITGNAFIGGTTTITSGTNSINTGSGALVVNGGLGLTGNANIGGTVRISNGLNSTSTTTGTLIVNGGLGLTGNAFIGGTTTISSNTNSSSSTTGALVVSGGAGIAQSLFVGGNLNFSGQLRGGTGTYAKTGGSGDICLDNGTDDTPAVLFYWNNNKNFGLDTFYSGSGTTKFRIVKELNESGGTELWSLDRNGLVTRSAYAVGEPISGAMYNYSDLNMAATTTISSTSYTTFATVTYTPKSSSSYIWIEFSATYQVAGTSADDHWSNIEVNGSEIVNANQIWANATGGGTRSGVLFPLAARYTNSSTAGIAISVRAKRGTSDDNNVIYGNNASGYMRIQEIGR